MPYVENRVVHDADSHLMELPDSLDEFLEARFRARYDALPKLKKHPRDADYVAQARAKQDDPQFRNTADENILLRKNYEALGSFKREDRPRALDDLGFASQLIFTTWCLGNFDLDQSGDVGLCYAVAQAHNRMMSAFCSVDRRFLGTGYVPLVNFEAALATAREAIDLGCKALLIPSRCPPGTSPSHVGFEPLWSLAQEARLPIVFHVGGEEKLPADYFNNGSAQGEGFSRRRGEFHFFKFHADSAFGANHARRADHRRRAGSPSAFEIRRHRTRRIVGAQLDALHGFRRLRLHQERAAPAKAIAETQRVRAPAGAGHALSS